MNDLLDKDTREVPGIRQLPRTIRPGRDLWPDIAGRLGPAEGRDRGGWKLRALAASVAVAFVVGLLLGRQLNEATQETTAPTWSSLAMQAALEASEREYRAAFREFMPVNTAGSELETRVVDSIENSWTELQQAESALQAALQEHPGNIYLNQKLLDLRSQQLDFMKQMAMLDQFSRRKI